MAQAPSPSRKAFIAERIASSRGPVNRLRARRYGLDTFLRRPPTLELYYEAGDPHSHLCAQLLPQLAGRLKTSLQVYIVPPPEAASYPEAERQRHFALVDAMRIAPAWGLRFDQYAQQPDEQQRRQAARQLVSLNDPAAFTHREATLADDLFSGNRIAEAPDNPSAKQQLQNNHRRRRKQGHYLPGMWQFNGEWFWGLDRLDILEQRLREKNLLEGSEPLACFDPANARLPALEPGQPLEFFFSFRSPYSYLAALDMQRLVAKLPVDLQVRPVLPMVMRGLPVPRDKRFYIVRDVKRRADQLGYPFGRIADPVGAGAERCLTGFPLTKGVEQQLAFLASASQAAMAEGIDLATDTGLRFATERAGLDWPGVKQKLDAGPDLDYAEANRQALFDAGLWGVPSFRIGSFATWGQDRLWMIEELLRRS